MMRERWRDGVNKYVEKAGMNKIGRGTMLETRRYVGKTDACLRCSSYLVRTNGKKSATIWSISTVILDFQHVKLLHALCNST